MPSINTEIQVNASAEAVWRELMDFGSYADWNPLVQYNSGEAQVGQRLDLKIMQPTGGSFPIKPNVTVRDENQKFEWLGSLLMPGIFDGRHTFEIAERDGGVLLKHYENFGGILKYPMGWFGVYRKTEPGFVLMNEALKKRVEERVAADGA